jgi:hypothetical protein
MAVYGPPDFTNLADTPALQRAAAQAWREDFGQLWESPPTGPRSSPSRVPIDGVRVGGVPGDLRIAIGGVRGDLLTAIMASDRTHRIADVVRGIEGAMHRKAEPFALTIDVLDVHGETATMVSATYALVPIGLYTDPARYPDWLRQTITPLA